MSKRSKTREANGGPEVRLIDAKRLFSEELERQMVSMGFSIDRYGRETCESVIRECVSLVYRQAWDEFMDWVETGDAARAEVMAAIRESIRGGSPYTRPTQIVKL